MKKRNIFFAAIVLLTGFTGYSQTCQNCGMGTVVPQSKLEVRGCTNDNTTSSLNVTTADSTSILYVRNDKRVGINTTSPGTSLEVRTAATGGLHVKTTSGNPEIGLFTNTSLSNARFSIGVDFADSDKLKIGTTAIGTGTIMTMNGTTANVGIGTTSPTAALHLKAGTTAASTSPLKFTAGTNLTAAEAGAVEFDGTRLYYTTSTPTRITLLGHNLGLSGGTTIIGGTATSENLTLQSTSNATKGKIIFGTSAYDEVNNRLGIGTASPAEALDVNGVAKLAQGSAPGVTTDKLYNVSGTLYWNGTNLIGGLLPSGSSAQTLRHDGTNWVASSLLYNNATNVGINTTGPDRRFDVLDASNPQLRLTYTDGSVYTDVQTTSSGYLYLNPSGSSVGVGTSSPGSLFEIEKNQNARSAYEVTNTTDGTAATSSLILTGEGTNTGNISVTASSYTGVSGWGDAMFIDAGTGIGGGIILSAAGSASDINFYSGGRASGDLAMTIEDQGRVGIGTTTPGYQLELSTNSAGKPTSSAWTITSDSRTKKDTASFTDGLNVIRQIKPITYKYNGLGHTPNNEEGIGILAQDMQAIAPYTVKTIKMDLRQSELATFPGTISYRTVMDENNQEVQIAQGELLGFDAHPLYFILINSVKQLDQENTELRTEIDALKARVTALEQQ